MDEFWNGPFMKDVRKKMLAGEKVEACALCDHSSYSKNQLRRHFNTFFKEQIDEIKQQTVADGETQFKPISFDYRINQCNFKCRMCGPRSSSSWGREVGWDQKYADYIQKNKYQLKLADQDIYQAIEQQRISELYWAGGEPLIMKRHWEIMNKVVQRGFADQVMVRYNSNLSQISWQNSSLVDLLRPFRLVQFFASIDGVGKVGEFIRTGLDFEQWLTNVKVLRDSQLSNLVLELDFTMTLPGLLGLEEMLVCANELGLKIRGKMVNPELETVLMSPLSLPKPLLHSLVINVESRVRPHINDKNRSILNLLDYLKTTEVYAEQSSRWNEALSFSYQAQKRVAQARGDGQNGRLSMADILARAPDILEWWNSLASEVKHPEATIQV